MSFASPSDGNFCIFNSFDLTKDSRLNTCSSGYCRSNLILSCKCPSLSCSILSDTDCKCIDVSTGSTYSTVCSCTGGGQGCCMNQCSSCISENACLSCKATNSYIDSVNDCSCSAGFYGNKPLTSASSCSACLIECNTCSSASSCTSCKDLNSFPDNNRCKCKVGYYGPYPLESSTCTKCLQECSECTDGLSCDKCIDSNASIHSGRCICDDGFYGPFPLLSSTCSKCLPECLVCTDGISCYECNDANSSLVFGRCKCNPGFYEISTALAFSCNPCLAECYTCTNSTSCDICQDPNSSSVGENNSCIGYCKDKCTNLNNTSCSDIYCKKCLSQDKEICEKCEDNYLNDNGKCIDCEILNTSLSCLNCDDICNQCGKTVLCEECINRNLGENDCFCQSGFKIFKGSCVRSYFNVNLKLNQFNQLLIQFSENLLEDLSASDFVLKLSNLTLSKEVLKVNQSSYKVLIDFQSLKSKSKLFVMFNPKILSISYSTLKKETYSLSLLDDENDLKSKLKNIQKFTSRGNSILVGLTLSASFFSFDFSSFFNFLNIVELLSIIFLFELDIPAETKELLNNLRVQNSIPNGLGKFIKDLKNRKINKSYAEYGYGYEILILNSGNALITLASASLLVLAHKTCLNKIILKFPRLSSLHQYLQFNILIRSWIQTSLELLITTSYGITLFTNNETWSEFDFSFCIIIFVISKQASQIIAFFITIVLCIKRSKIENEDEKKKFESKFNVLLYELKENSFPLFYFIFFIRRILLVMILNFVPIPIMKLAFSTILSFGVIKI